MTDAAFVLGMLGDGELAGGISLDADAARAALAPLARGSSAWRSTTWRAGS